MSNRKFKALVTLLTCCSAMLAFSAHALTKPSSLSNLDVSASLVTRWDYSNDTTDFNETSPDSINFFRSQLRANFKYFAYPELSLFFQPQFSYAWGSSAIGTDPNLGVHQAYIRYHYDPITLFVGRQIYDYAKGFILSENQWDLVGNAYDSIRTRVKFGIGYADLFWTKVTESGNGISAPGDDDLFGIYGEFSFGYLLESFSAYAIHFSNQTSSPKENSTTVGVRAATHDENSGFSYAIEPVFQNSRSSAQMALDVDIRYQLYGHFSPIFQFGITHASSNYQPLYPENHDFLGRADLFGLRNITSLSLAAGFEVEKIIGFNLEYFLLNRSDTSTPAYQIDATTGYGFNGTDKSIASELDLVFNAWIDENFKIEIVGAFVFAGSFLSQNSPGSDAQVAFIKLHSMF